MLKRSRLPSSSGKLNWPKLMLKEIKEGGKKINKEEECFGLEDVL